MNHWLRMTFEIDDPDNHALAVSNREKAQASYTLRVEVMMDAVREALRRLRDDP